MWAFTVQFMFVGRVRRCLWLMFTEYFGASVDVKQCSKHHCVWGRGEKIKKKRRGQKWPHMSGSSLKPRLAKPLMITTWALAFLITHPGLTESHKAWELGGADGTKTVGFLGKDALWTQQLMQPLAAPLSHYCCWRGGEGWHSKTRPPPLLKSWSTGHVRRAFGQELLSDASTKWASLAQIVSHYWTFQFNVENKSC